MAESTQFRRRNNRDRTGSNRNRNRDRNNYRRHIKQKVPRRAKKPSIWKRILSLLGIGQSNRPKPPRNKSKSRNSRETGKRNNNRANKKPFTGEKPQRNAGPPEKVPVTSPRLYVGNLSYSTTESNLVELFEPFGEVITAEIVSHRRNNRSKGYAFVEMGDLQQAKEVAAKLHDQEYMERKIIVNGAISSGRKED